MTTLIVGDLRTGRRWQSVPFTKVAWEQRRNAPETLTATVPVRDVDVRALNLTNTAAEGKSFMAIIENGDVFAGGGPMNTPAYDQDEGTYQISALGLGDHLRGVPILPPLAGTIDPASFTVPDPDPTKPGATIPNPALATSFTNLSLGSIVRGVIAQLMSWPGGNLPIVLPTVVAGVHTRVWDGVQLKDLWSAIREITELVDGIDVSLEPKWTADRLAVEWVLRVGTNEKPRFRSASIHRWDLSVENKSTRGLRITGDATTMGSIAFYTGGRSADVALVERASDPYLLDLGFPLKFIVDTTHSTVEERSTLQSYARQGVRLGRSSSQFWSFQARKDSPPLFGQYRIGDLCELIIRDDPVIPTNKYTREIAGISGDEGDWVTITTSEASNG